MTMRFSRECLEGVNRKLGTCYDNIRGTWKLMISSKCCSRCQFIIQVPKSGVHLRKPIVFFF